MKLNWYLTILNTIKLESTVAKCTIRIWRVFTALQECLYLWAASRLSITLHQKENRGFYSRRFMDLLFRVSLSRIKNFQIPFYLYS